MLAEFHDKKCCNFINLFLCILWDLIVMGLVLSWWRLLKTVDLVTWLATGSRLGTSKMLCEKHIWKFKSQDISKVSCDLAKLGDDPWDTLTANFKCDSYTFHLYYIYTLYPQNSEENPIDVSTISTFYKELLILNREILVVSSPSPLPLSYIERRFVPKQNSHPFRL